MAENRTTRHWRLFGHRISAARRRNGAHKHIVETFSTFASRIRLRMHRMQGAANAGRRRPLFFPLNDAIVAYQFLMYFASILLLFFRSLSSAIWSCLLLSLLLSLLIMYLQFDAAVASVRPMCSFSVAFCCSCCCCLSHFFDIIFTHL